jgi:arylformamidase
MKIYDITQELFSGHVYPGDPAPSYERELRMEEGASCNLTRFQMGAHNATHLDAPFHFYNSGKTIDQIELSRCIGPCSVIEISGYEKQEDLIKILEACQKRILIKGNSVVTLEFARQLNQLDILLIGVETQSVGAIEAPMPVHLELLGKEVVLLEGLVLGDIKVGEYFLFAAPLKLGGSDGAPCRAVLLKFDECSTCNC